MNRLLLLAALTLAACSKPQPVSNDLDLDMLSTGGSNAIPRPLTNDSAETPGAWRFQASAAGSAATFGTVGDYPAFAIRCEPQTRSIALVRDATVPVHGAMLEFTTTEGKTASYPALPANENRPVAIARATSGDSFLRGELSAAKAKITITVEGAAPLTVPVDDALRTVIATCPR